MRKIYAALLSLLFLFICSLQVNAQVNAYIFTSGSGGTLEDMSSGTTQLVGSGSDDGASAVTAIGFNFTFNGTVYTQFSANANGLVRLGPSAVTGAFNNVSTTSGFLTTTNLPEVAPYFDDLATGTGGKVHYKLVGSAPNQKLVVEWFVTVPRATAGAANARFQVWLHETSDKITFIYGTGMVVNSLNGGYTVGLAASVTNFQSVTTATNTVSTAAHNGTQSTAITSGAYYEFLPPPPCTTPPEGGATESSVANACPAIPFTLSVISAGTGAGLTYQWQSSLTGLPGSYTDIPGATSATYIAPGQPAPTYYQRRITCSGVDNYSTPLLVGQNAVADCYCPVTFPSSIEPITLVTFSDINNATSPTVGGTPALENFTAIVGNVLKGQTYPITVKGNTDGNFTTHVNVYIDWNQDGDFDDAGENHYIGTIVNSTGVDAVQATGNISIPPGALDGNTRMRVIKKFSTQAPPCNNAGFGQAEDYTLSITTPACPVPTGVTVGAITTTSAEVSYTGTTGTVYVEYGPVGFTPGTGATPGAGGTVLTGASPVALPGLAHSTEYDVYVRQDCGGSIFSANSPAVRFQTLCGVNSLPFAETFAAYATTFPPTCWTRNNATYLIGNISSAFGVGTGSAKFDFWGASSGTQLDLTTPALTPTPAGYWLTFDHAYATFTTQVDRLEIWTSTDDGANYTLLTTYNGGVVGPLNTVGGAGTSGSAFTPNATQWGSKAIGLPTGTNRIRLRGVSAFGNNLYLDNIRITSCVQPTGITSSAVTQTTATISWTASVSTPSGGYQWEVRTSGAGGSGATGLVASGTTAAAVTTANVTGLTANTDYNVYVRSDCGGSDFSAWGGPASFKTDCDPFTLPLFENFATYATTFPPTCWTRNNTTLLVGAASSAFGIGTGSARVNFWAAPTGTFDLRTPPFTPTSAGYWLMFDHAYATFSGEVDRLEILYSTDGGATYTGLTTYLGGASGPLNTGGTTFNPFASFVPTASQWASKAIALPVGTNRLIFRAVSAFGDDLFLDNILITSCLPPTGVTSSAVTQTTATISWTASVSTPSGGYQWEVRSSGAAGSGATGLVASGTTAAGVTTANVTGLTAGTAYSVYVRSDCGGSDFSTWTNAYSLVSLCNPITSFPYTETFENASATRICWRNQQLSGNFSWTYGAGSGNGGPVTTAHGGTVNAQFFGSFYGGEQALLVSPELDLSSPGMIANGVDLEFWVANPSWLGDINPLRVLYKTSAAGTWNVLPGGVFASAINAWTKIEIPNLPNISSTYYIAFEGTQLWGWGIAIDDVVIKEGPTCRKPTNVGAVGITPTSIEVTFTSPGTDFIVEYGAPGFTPGTGATAGAGGTIVTGTASPIIIPGLNASTTYDVYIRRVCIAGVDYSENVKATATTQCVATNIPYLQNFETAFVPGMPTCTSIQDVNGNSGSFWLGTGAGGWETYTDANPLTYVSPVRSLLYYYDFNDLTRPADDWFFTQGLNLTAGTTYRLKFFYKALDGVNFPEKLEVKYGMGASVSNMTSGTLFTNGNVSSVYASPFDSVRVDFTPTATGAYYFGFHAFSDGDKFGLLIDDISVNAAPQVDVGISGMTLPNLTCPVNNVIIQAEVKNYNLTPVDFSVNPVTINARIVNGATTTDLPPTVLNSGVLAPNATMGVYLTTAYNFVAGTHQITLNTTSPLDPEVANDTLKRTVVVNPNPPVPVITPAAPQVCLGNGVQLTVPTPAATTAVHTQSTGPITVGVPDGVAAGTTSTINVTGIPSTATITGISVTMNMTHTWISDMSIGLKAPNGRILNLFNQRGGNGDNLVNTVISSASTTSLATGTPPYTGTFAADAAAVGPTGNVADALTFADLYSIAGGNWTLVLRDHVFFDPGTLTSWSITINYSYVPALTWSPVTELFTNAAATTPYVAGTNSYSVYAKPTVTRTYTATSTGAGGCTTTGIVTVTVNPNPVVTIGSIPDTVCISDQSIPLVGDPVGGTWSGIGVSGNNFLPPTTAVGNYLLTYSYTNAFGCPGTATKRIWVKDCPDRIVLLRDNAITLFPNPTDDGRFNIRINSVLYNHLTMRVYTNNGAIVRTQQFNGLVYGRVVPIDLSALPGGVYVVEFAHENAGPRTAEKSFKVIIGH